MRDAIFIAVGLAGILIEFLRPGLAIPGAAGLVFLMLGLVPVWRGEVNWNAIVFVDGPMLMLAILLLVIAHRARRNKTRLN